MNPEIINEHPLLKNFKLTQYNISPDSITTENDQIINKIKYEELDPINLLNEEPRDSPIEKYMEEMDEHLKEASDKLNEEIQAGIIQIKEMNSSESLNEKVKNGGQTKFSGKKRCRNEEANKNSTKNRTKYNINKIHKSKKEGKPKVDLLDEKSEIKEISHWYTMDFEYKYKSQIFEKLIELAQKNEISYFDKIMNEPFKEILKPNSQETWSFLEQTPLQYYDSFFEKIQINKTKNNETKKKFKKKNFNAEAIIKSIRYLYDIVKENESKKEKEKEEKEKEEKKEAEIEEILNNNLIYENEDLLINNSSSIFGNDDYQIYLQQMDDQEKSDSETKEKTNTKFTDKNINSKIKNRTLEFMIKDFNDKSEKMFITIGKKKKGQIGKITLHIDKIKNNNKYSEDLTFMQTKLKDTISNNEKICYESEEVEKLLNMRIIDYLQNIIMKDEIKKKKFIEVEKDKKKQNQKSNKCREIIFEIIKTKNLDGLILLIMTDVIKISFNKDKRPKYIKFQKSVEVFEDLIKNLKQYEDLNLDSFVDESVVNKFVQNFGNISQKFEQHLENK